MNSLLVGIITYIKKHVVASIVVGTVIVSTAVATPTIIIPYVQEQKVKQQEIKDNVKEKDEEKNTCEENFILNEDGICVENIDDNTTINETQEYTVTFNSDGGSILTKQIVKENEKVIKPNNPTKKDYTFIEWQLDGKKYNFDSIVTKDITLKAIWKKNETTNNQNNNNSNQNNNNTNNDQTNKADLNLNDNIQVYNWKDGKSSYTQIKNECIGNYENDYPDECRQPLSTVARNEILKFKGVKMVESANVVTLYPITFVNKDKQYYKYATSSTQINKILKQYNIVEIGSMWDGAAPTLLLTEAICKDFNLSCDRW